MPGGKLKRFYESVSVARQEAGFAVLLDNKPVRTPARAELLVPNEKLAEAIAGEWRAQSEKLRPDTMPLTRLANTALDRVAAARMEMIERVMAFGRSDLVCYRAEHPRELVEQQNKIWNPLLDWLKQTHGAEMKTGAGISFIEQPEKALNALARALQPRDDFTLAALYAVASVTGSLVIALALAAGRLDADAAFAAAHLDEAHQAAKWGTDAEAHARRTRTAADLAAAALFLRLLAAPSVALGDTSPKGGG